MPTFRATVWTLSAMASAVEGNAAIQRRIVEDDAPNASTFKAIIMDQFTRVPDDEVSIGPVSEVRPRGSMLWADFEER